MPTLLIRYGEIGLKSASVRRRFEGQLVDDIKRRHAKAGIQCVISQARGRIFLDSDEWRRSCELLSKTFGIVSFSPVARSPSDLEGLTRAVLEFAEPIVFEGASFAIRTRRSGNHPYTSQTLAASLGEAVLNAWPEKHLKVNLDEPDVEVSVEVRDREAYVFNSALAGPGGMPLGTQGRVLTVVESERGIASSWMMMKRGCSVLVAVRGMDAIGRLEEWYPNLKTVPPEDDLFRLAEANGCIGLALEWSTGELESRGALKGPLPVFYPLIGMNEEEIRGLIDRILA
jgi:thiamine biosynthesis protein ThiI